MNSKVLQLAGISLSLFLTSCSTSQDSTSSPTLSGLNENQTKLTRMANKMRENGDYQTALKFYLQVSNQEAETPEVLFAIADCYSKLGQSREALSRLLTFKEDFPDHPELNVEFGKVYLALNEPKQCIKYFSAALKTHPKNTTVLNGLGICHDLEKNHEAAQKYYMQALTVNPKATNISANLGLSYTFSQSTIHQAITILEKIANGPEATPQDRQNLALAYGLSGDFKKAAGIFSIDLKDEDVENNIAYIKNARQKESFKTSPHKEIMPTQSIEMKPLHESSTPEKKKKNHNTALEKQSHKKQPPHPLSTSSNEIKDSSASSESTGRQDAFMKQAPEKTTHNPHGSRQEVRTADDNTQVSADDTDLLEAEALLL